ncbi:serine/arginine repetitive matrix protein 5-like isoform X2 [Littorina saxatilis]
MAICGAPWCDFMAICSKTREIMLKRVFFQPRYWEHISSRLRQFCFALEETEIMRELGRDVYSGAMTRRLQQQSMQETLFPAEDIITVENLLICPAPGMFRGPSGKLLSFHILVGETYTLPSTLSRYSHQLLAKVDVEIRRKPSPEKKGGSPLGEEEEEETGGACHKVFCEMDLRPPESPERVFGDVISIFDADHREEGSDMAEMLTEPSYSSDTGQAPEVTHHTSSPAASSGRESAVEKVGAQVSESNSNKAPERPTPASPAVTNSSKDGQGATTRFMSTSSETPMPSKPKAQSLPYRKISRLGSSPKEPNSASTVKAASSGSMLRSTPPGNSSPAAAAKNLPVAAVSGGLPRAAVSASSPRAAVSGSPRVAAPRGGKGQVSARGQVAARGQGQTAGRGQVQTAGRGHDQAAVRGRGLTTVRGRGQTAVRGRGQASGRGQGQTAGRGRGQTTERGRGQTTERGLGQTAGRGQVAGKVHQAAVAVNNTARSSALATSSTATPTSSPASSNTAAKAQQPTSAHQDKPALRSAKSEWEVAASRGTQSAAAQRTPPSAHSRDGNIPASSEAQSQDSGKDVQAASGAATPVGSTPKVGGQGKDMQWSALVATSGSSFVPPGLTLLSAGDSSEGARPQAGDTQVGNKAGATQQNDTGGKPLDLAQKRPHPLQDARQEVQSKKPLLEKPADKNNSGPSQQMRQSVSTERTPTQQRESLSAERTFGQQRGSVPTTERTHAQQRESSSAERLFGQQRGSTSMERTLGQQGEPMSVDRNPIHRPWQGLGQEESREYHRGDPARRPDRDMPHFDTPAHAHEGGGPGQRPRGWGDRERPQDMSFKRGPGFEDRGGHRMHPMMERDRSPDRSRTMDRERPQDVGLQRMPERVGARIPSLLNRERDRPGPENRVFDYDHQDHIVSQDLQRRRQAALAQSQNARTIPVSAALQFDSVRRLPLDEQLRRQEMSQRELFGVSRGGALDAVGAEGAALREQRQRQIQQLHQQSLLRQQQLHPASQLAGLMAPLHGSWSGGQALRPELQHRLELQPHLIDPRFPGARVMDPRLGRDGNQGQHPRGFPPGRHHFDY